MQIWVYVVLCSVWYMARAQQTLTISIIMYALLLGVYVVNERLREASLWERKIWKQKKKENHKAKNSEARVPKTGVLWWNLYNTFTPPLLLRKAR